MAYHSKGINKNKKIRQERKKPLPLELMKNDKIDRIRIARGRIDENPFINEII